MKDPVNPFAMTREDGATRLNQLGFALMSAPALIGAQQVAGFEGDGEVDRKFVFGVVALCGALGGWLFGLGRAPALAGLLGGALASVGGLVLTHFWIAGRESFFIIEAILLWMVGCVPGAMIYKTLIDRAEQSPKQRGER